MRAVDTNVLARYYLADDPVQSPLAARVLEAGEIFVPKTVFLELAWVLEFVAEQASQKVRECLSHLIALPGVIVEDHDEVQAALDLYERGIDFADALHLCASSACSELLTFDDRGFIRRAAHLGVKTRVAKPMVVDAPEPPEMREGKAAYRARRKRRKS